MSLQLAACVSDLAGDQPVKRHKGPHLDSFTKRRVPPHPLRWAALLSNYLILKKSLTVCIMPKESKSQGYKDYHDLHSRITTRWIGSQISRRSVMSCLRINH